MAPGEVYEKQPPYSQLSYFINREKEAKKKKKDFDSNNNSLLYTCICLKNGEHYNCKCRF